MSSILYSAFYKFPIQNVLGLGTHVELEIAHRVLAIGEKRDLLVKLKPLRGQDFIEPCFDFVSSVWTKPKRLFDGVSSVSSSLRFKGQETLAHNDLKVLLLGFPTSHVPPVNPDYERSIGDGKIGPISRTAVDEAPLFLAQLGF